MIGREDSRENDLFFTCSLIEYIARKTTNRRSDVVNALGLGRENLTMLQMENMQYHLIGIWERYTKD